MLAFPESYGSSGTRSLPSSRAGSSLSCGRAGSRNGMRSVLSSARGESKAAGVDASALDRRSPEGRWEASPLVEPPWGRDRANKDRPPVDEVAQRQRDYQQLLDEQSAVKAAAMNRKAQENADIEAKTARSLATRTHAWGAEACNVQLERAVYRELLATVAHRQSKAQQSKYAESQDFARWKEESERQLAYQWQSQRRRHQEDMAELANSWRNAAEEKKRRQDEEKARNLMTERETTQRLLSGMAAPRRMRKAPTETKCGQVAQVQVRAVTQG